MENLRERIKIELVNNAKNYKKYVNKPSFVSQKIFDKSFVAIHQVKLALTLNKPIYVRFSILDISKLLTYEFHYKYIERKYNNNAKLLFADTDSLVYESENKYVNEDFDQNKTRLILAFIQKTQKVIGKMKDEVKRNVICGFFRLKSDSLIFESSEEIKKAKCVNKNVVKT